MNELNDKQSEAVHCENKCVLVLAGAGSGKTSTLLHRINYLIDEKQVSPTDILAITFTKDAAAELRERLIKGILTTSDHRDFSDYSTKAEIYEQEAHESYKWVEQLTIKTFHSFCYSIMNEHGVKEFDNRFKIISDKKGKDDEFSTNAVSKTVFEIMRLILIELCDKDEFLIRLKRYILDYMIDKMYVPKKSSPTKDGKYFTSLDGTKVRSKSEQFIADWFYRHGIRYEYEPSLVVAGDFVFHPDFYIPDAGLYIEHVSDLSYPMEGKKTQFEKGKLLYALTFESMTKDSAVFNATLDHIVKDRLPVNFKRNHYLNYEEEFIGYHIKIKEFINHIIRINDIIKADNLELNTILNDAGEDQHERVRLFYELAGPIMKRYKDYCVDKSYLDFNDLISRSVSLFKKNDDILNYYKNRYQYILIDEFQDVNSLQIELVKLLITDHTHLFCVGDDWQNIYGFRGADVKYTVDFKAYFPQAKIVKLSLNYRSTQNIIKASNDVIQNNRVKVSKIIRSTRRSGDKIVVYAGNNVAENVKYCADKVRELMNAGVEDKDILFLYRVRKMAAPYSAYFKNESLSVQFKTIHASKGLEAKVVFILGLTDDENGFPHIWSEDRIYNIVKKTNYDLLLEEERRLFYVSITRAKDSLFLITERGIESKFIKEISKAILDRKKLKDKLIPQTIIYCINCSMVMDEDWVVCPRCSYTVNSLKNKGEEKL